MHANIHRIRLKKYSDYQIGSGCQYRLYVGKLVFCISQKKIRFIIQTRLFRRELHRLHDSSDSRPHAFHVCRLLLGLLLRGLSLPRCRGPAHHMVCDGMVYQYMLWYVTDWCMSPRPTKLGKLPLHREGDPKRN